jgi:hypothetical protein
MLATAALPCRRLAALRLPAPQRLPPCLRSQPCRRRLPVARAPRSLRGSPTAPLLLPPAPALAAGRRAACPYCRAPPPRVAAGMAGRMGNRDSGGDQGRVGWVDLERKIGSRVGWAAQVGRGVATLAVSGEMGRGR